MSQAASLPYRHVDIWPAEVAVERRADGTRLLASPTPLGPYPQRLTDRVEHWAKVRPDATMVARRHVTAAGGRGDWQRVTYAQALDAARRIGESLLARGLSATRPLLILSDNDIEHMLLGFGAMVAGVPYAPISPAYSLVSQDFGKLRDIIGRMAPAVVFASDGERYARAIAAAVPPEVEVVVTDRPPPGRKATAFADLLAATPGPALAAAHAAVGPATVAKVLFTSGSTGLPKGVIVTQQMLCSNLEINTATVFRSLRETPPVLVDWLPWNHTFGGNANVGLVLYHGGTLYIDDGRPAPGLFDETVRNLEEIAPTVYFNVPKGFELLVHHMRANPSLRRNFYSRLDMTFFAGASLAQHVWDALDELAVATTGERVVMMTGLGATETGPTALMCTAEGARSGSIGLPCPGVTLKLVPTASKLEARVKSPSVTPGYWGEPALTARAFDEDGFYCFNDAVRLIDPADARKGLLFDGRLSEDFKLSSGTWVSVGPLRARFIAAFAPLARDVVITGLDRDFLGAILIPDVEACRAVCPELATGAPLSDIVASMSLRSVLADRLQVLAATATGSSTLIRRLVVLGEPLSIDAGEVTDKGSINQRAVLEHRAAHVRALYEEEAADGVIRA